MGAGDPVEAIEIIESYLTNHEKSADLYILLAQYYQQQNAFDKALESFNYAIKYEGDKGKVYFQIAQLYQRSNDVNNAIEAYKKSIAWSDNKQISLIAVSHLFNRQHKPLEGIKLTEQFLGKDGYSTELQMVIAHAYYLARQYNNAEEKYKSLLKSAPLQATYHENVVVGLSLIYQASKKNDKATQLLVKYLKKKPKNVLMNTSLAEIYIYKKQWQKAYDIYLGMLAHSPKQAVLLNNAAFVALNLSLYEDAKKHSLASLAITNDHPDSLDTLGWVYYLTQDFDKALPLFRKALALDFSKIEIKYHLALTLKALNREKEAFNTLVEVVNSKRNFSDKQFAKQQLQEWIKELNAKKTL